MRVFATAIFLVLSSTAALSQPAGSSSTSEPGREQTFRDIGRILQGTQRAISPAQPGALSADAMATAPAVVPPGQSAPVIAAGAELTASTPITALTGPSPTATIGATIAPGTAVRVDGAERGFVQVTPLQDQAAEGRSTCLREP